MRVKVKYITLLTLSATALPLVSFAQFVPIVPTIPVGGTPACQIEVSASLSPKFHISNKENTTATLSGSVKASDGCILPISVVLPTGTKRLLEKSSQFSTLITLPMDHFKNHELEVIATDSCGYANGTVVSSCTIQEYNVTGTGSAERAQAVSACIDPAHYPSSLGYDTAQKIKENKVVFQNTSLGRDTESPGFVAVLVSTADIVPWSVKIVSSDEYVTRSQRESAFTPKAPYSPLDIFDVELQIRHCNPPDKPFTGSIVTTDAKKSSVGVGALDERGFRLVKREGTLGTYQGTFSFDPLEKPSLESLVDSIAAGRVVNIVINDSDPKTPAFHLPIPMTNCAQIHGTGRHKIVSMRGKSGDISIATLALDGFGLIKEFSRVDPFKTYKTEFSHFIDLKNHNDTKWTLRNSSNDALFFSGNTHVKNATSCGSGGQYLFYNGVTERAHVLSKKSGVAFLHTSDDHRTTIHELGHSFGGLSDEYQKGSLSSAPLFIRLQAKKLLSSNCSAERADAFVFSGTKYGDAIPICGVDEYYRSSLNSYMNIQYEDGVKFNVVSCGYLLKAIKGGSAKSHWPECMTLDTEKPTGKNF